MFTTRSSVTAASIRSFRNLLGVLVVLALIILPILRFDVEVISSALMMIIISPFEMGEAATSITMSLIVILLYAIITGVCAFITGLIAADSGARYGAVVAMSFIILRSIYYGSPGLVLEGDPWYLFAVIWWIAMIGSGVVGGTLAKILKRSLRRQRDRGTVPL